MTSDEQAELRALALRCTTNAQTAAALLERIGRMQERNEALIARIDALEQRVTTMQIHVYGAVAGGLVLG